MKLATKKRIGSITYHVFVFVLATLVFYPVLWLIASSLKP